MRQLGSVRGPSSSKRSAGWQGKGEASPRSDRPQYRAGYASIEIASTARPERPLDAGDRVVQFGDLADGGRLEGALPRPPQGAQPHLQRLLAELAARRAVVVGSHGLVSLRLADSVILSRLFDCCAAGMNLNSLIT